MIVGDLHVIGIAVHEPKADPPLGINSDRILPCPVTLHRKARKDCKGRQDRGIRPRATVPNCAGSPGVSPRGNGAGRTADRRSPAPARRRTEPGASGSPAGRIPGRRPGSGSPRRWRAAVASEWPHPFRGSEEVRRVGCRAVSDRRPESVASVEPSSTSRSSISIGTARTRSIARATVSASLYTGMITLRFTSVTPCEGPCLSPLRPSATHYSPRAALAPCVARPARRRPSRECASCLGPEISR